MLPPPQRRFSRAVRPAVVSAALIILSVLATPTPALAQADDTPIAGRFDTAEDFVAQAYRDVFAREPDPAGLAHWSDRIRNGQPPSEVLSRFVSSPEFAGRVAPITRLYLTILGRVPTALELRTGISRLGAGQSLRQQAGALLRSPSFGRGGNVTESVARILDNTDEPGDPRLQARPIMSGRQTLADYAVARSESSGHAARTAPTVAATAVYLGLLRRSPEPRGLAFWSNEVRRSLRLELFIESVLDGSEYRSRFPAPTSARPSVTVVAAGLDIPWDVAPLPGGSLLVTERAGRLVVIGPGGGKRTVDADLNDLFAQGETGLMGLALDPDFAANRRFYTCQGHRDPLEIQVVAWTLAADGSSAERVADPLVSGLPLVTGRHGGCQLEFDRTGALVVGTGDAATGSLPQDLGSLGGKVLRVDARTGGPAAGNPFLNSANARTRLIYSYGHRNVQGLSIHPRTGQIWSVEHGPGTDDEVNRITAGANYGWNPVPGYNESVPMTDRTAFPDAVAAAFATGRPTLAMSGGAFLHHRRWGSRRGALAIASLKDETLRLLSFDDDGRFRGQETLIDGTHGRLRAAELGPDGSLFVTTSNGGGEDKVLRIG